MPAIADDIVAALGQYYKGIDVMTFMEWCSQVGVPAGMLAAAQLQHSLPAVRRLPVSAFRSL